MSAHDDHRPGAGPGLYALEGARSGSARADRVPPAGTAAAIFGVGGARLTAEEAAFLRDARPYGFILFARNIERPDQVRALVDEMRDCVGWRAPVLIDQEGGRVARLAPPYWRRWAPTGAWCAAVPDASAYKAELYEAALRDALRERARMIAAELAAVGIDVNCAPVLDVLDPGGHDIIGDRALGVDPALVAARGAEICAGLRNGGVAPVIKHLPGHGRARLDSHQALPRVEASRAELAARDFAPFRALRAQPYAMTAHVLYAAIDPERCATVSPIVVGSVIRGEIGFDGFLMTDDLSMGALEGDFAERARASLAAGCDAVLHCNGSLGEMRAVMAGARALDPAGLRRAEAAAAAVAEPSPYSFDEGERALDAVVARLFGLNDEPDEPDLPPPAPDEAGLAERAVAPSSPSQEAGS